MQFPIPHGAPGSKRKFQSVLLCGFLGCWMLAGCVVATHKPGADRDVENLRSGMTPLQAMVVLNFSVLKNRLKSDSWDNRQAEISVISLHFLSTQIDLSYRYKFTTLTDSGSDIIYSTYPHKLRVTETYEVSRGKVQRTILLSEVIHVKRARALALGKVPDEVGIVVRGNATGETSPAHPETLWFTLKPGSLKKVLAALEVLCPNLQ